VAAHHTALHLAAAELVARRIGVSPDDVKVTAPPRPELGDVSVGCHRAGKNAAAVAASIAADFVPTELLASASAAGPFVNFQANRPHVFRLAIDGALRGALLPRELGAGQTICIDFSSPNVSKHLAYHHIRSTMIGHALVQIFRALGYRAVGINHLGDWGTTHGMLIAAYRMWCPAEPLNVETLNELYVRYREAAKTDPSLDDHARLTFKQLEAGDPETRALWQRFRDISLAEYQAIYDQLGVTFDEIRGESAYEADLARVLRELEAAGLVVESQGARVVELPDEKTPILLVTKDGTTLYATRDVAAAEYRWNTYHFARSLYVVDRGQGTHFRQLFKLLAKMGHAWASRCEHVPFGLVRFGGKKTGTRTGNVVLLQEVIDRARAAVAETIAEKNPELAPDHRDRVAGIVGIGGVVFANLVSQRDKDVDFEWEKVLSLEGDSGPYLQYTHARCAAIARDRRSVVGEPIEPITAIDGIDTGPLAHDAEWAVARRLLDFPEAVVRAAAACEPHVVCHYLLELAGDFSRWYTAGNADHALRVLVPDRTTRRARLALVAAVQAVLRDGLALLGISAPTEM
jgi:arginyl-tRNA synthetase